MMQQVHEHINSSVLGSMQMHDGQMLTLEASHRPNFAPNEYKDKALCNSK